MLPRWNASHLPCCRKAVSCQLQTYRILGYRVLFYVFAAVVLMFTALAAAKLVNIALVPLVFFFGIVIVCVIGALQLRNDQRLSEKHFVSLMLASLKSLPLLKRDKPQK